MLYDKINYGTPFYRSRWSLAGTSTLSELPINRDAADLPSFCIVSFALHTFLNGRMCFLISCVATRSGRRVTSYKRV